MASIDFEYTQEQLKNIAGQILEKATSLGATSAQVEINESIATSVDVLNSEIENFETSYDRTMGLTVYIGNKRGNVGITSITLTNIEQIIKQAIDIANYTQEDLANGIANQEFLCTSFNEDLQLYNPIDISNQLLIDKAKNIEQLGLQIDPRITSSDGASVDTAKFNFVIANTHGLNLGYNTTRFNSSLSLIGTSKSGMQTDYWYSSARSFPNLSPDKTLVEKASSRVLRRLNKGSIQSGVYPVIFDSPIAKSIIGNFLGAISGNSLFRRLSFLNDSLGTQVFPTWLSITDDPFLIGGLASCYFDNEGVQVNKRQLVTNGVVNGYILSNYSARKLNMQPTGNAGGTHNILVSHNTSDSTEDMIKQMGSGLVIIETIGSGLNMVTGDYSVGASALWVEHGEIQFFVDTITIAGNLRDIFKNIIAINQDTEASSMLCGSMLVDGITVSV